MFVPRKQLFHAVLDSPPALLTKKAIIKGHVLSSSSDFSSGQELTNTLLVKGKTPRRQFKTLMRESKKIKMEKEAPHDSEEHHTTLIEEASSTYPKESTKKPEIPSTSETKVFTKGKFYCLFLLCISVAHAMLIFIYA